MVHDIRWLLQDEDKPEEAAEEAVYLWDDRLGTVANGVSYFEAGEGDAPSSSITMTDCPPRLRGDLSKWLCEINTGVYVGQLSQPRARCPVGPLSAKNLQTGRATMVYTTNSEQKNGFPGAQHRLDAGWILTGSSSCAGLCRKAWPRSRH